MTPQRLPENSVDTPRSDNSAGRRYWWRPLLLLAVIAGWLAVAAVGGQSLGKLGSVSSNSQETFLPRNAESVLAARELAAFNESGALPALVVLQGEQPAQQVRAGNPVAYAAGLVGKITVDGRPLTELLAPGQPSIAAPAKDGSGALLVIPLSETAISAGGEDGAGRLGDVVTAIRDQVGALSGASTVHVTGPAGFAADIGSAFAGIDGLLLIVTLSVVLLILLVVYRSVVLPIIVLFSAVTALSLAGLAVYLLARDGVLVVNGQSQGILSILVIGAATDYSLLLVARYREELTRHESRFTAMWTAWRACLPPIAASAATVCAGLLCLLVSDLNSTRSLGPIGAIGIVAAVLASMTLLPALLMLGRWVFWPRIPRNTEHDRERAEQHGIWNKVAHWVQRRPRAIWITVTAVLLAFCAAVPLLNAEGTSDADTFLTEVDAVTGAQVLERSYDAGAATPIRVVVASAAKDAAAQAIQAVPGVTAVKAGENEVGGRVVLDVATASAEDGALVRSVRTAAHAADPSSLVGGDAAIKMDTVETAQSDLWTVIPIVLVVVLLVLILLLRAVVAPLMLITATVISFGTALGVAALVFQYIFDFPGADPTVPLLGFVFLVALGVDYSIFLMTRAREETVKHGTHDGMMRALRVTGGVITSAGVVLAATFAALSVIPLLFMAQLAFIVAFGVLLDTLIVRSLLVPALTIDIGRKTWWPSRLSKPDAPGEQAGAVPVTDRSADDQTPSLTATSSADS